MWTQTSSVINRLAQGLILSLCLLLINELDTIGQSVATKNPAVDAARKREDAVKTVYVEYKRNEVTAVGAISEKDPFKTSPTPIPTRETTLESQSRYMLDGTKFRIEENHPTFLLPQGIVLNRSFIWAFDGSLAKSMSTPSSSTNNNPRGRIARGANDSKTRLIQLLPLTMTFRGMTAMLSQYLVSDMKSSGVSLPIDGGNAEEYAIALDPKVTEIFWLDPLKDYVIRRHQRRVSQKLTEQTDITYRNHDACGWIPHTWIRTEYSASNKVSVFSTIVVVDLRINESQPQEQFSLRFPAESVVEDDRTNKEYIVLRDGSMQERSRKGDLLSLPIAQPGVRTYSWFHFILLSIGGLFVLTMGVFLIRRYSKRAT